MNVPAADDLLARRHETCALGVEHDPCRSCVAINAAADLLKVIDDLHQPRDLYDGDPYCKSCDEEHPCATARLLHPGVTGW